MAKLPETAIGKLKSLAEQVSVREGCLLYDLEFAGGTRNRVLKVFVDRLEGQVSIDDCSAISKGLSLLLDVEDVVPGGAYELEVSSPGLERRLTQSWHFEKVVGQQIRVQTLVGIHPPTGVNMKKTPKSIEGQLVKTDEMNLIINFNKNEWIVPRDEVSQAKVVFELQSQPKKNLKKKR